MAGHIQQRGETSWRLHAFIGRDANGRKRYATKTVHGTKREADRALAALVTEVSRDRSASAAERSMTVPQVLTRRLDAKSVRLSPVTVDQYKVAIKHIEPAIGSMRVARLRPHRIEDLYDALLSKGQSGASIRKVHWTLRQSLAWAHRRGYTAIVATDGIEPPALGERKIQETSATRPAPAGPVTLHDPVFWPPTRTRSGRLFPGQVSHCRHRTPRRDSTEGSASLSSCPLRSRCRRSRPSSR
jgi:hypothetical protein